MKELLEILNRRGVQYLVDATKLKKALELEQRRKREESESQTVPSHEATREQKPDIEHDREM